MIPLDKLRQVRIIVTHGHCPDGIASAILCHDVLPKAEVVFCQYGTAQRREMVAEPGMLFVDFTPEPSRNQEFVDAGAIVLDHHKGAKEQVEAYGDLGMFADEAREPGVSGALLAFKYVWAPRDRELRTIRVATASEFAMIAGVRDTWQRESFCWSEACAQAEALRFWPIEQLLAIQDPFQAGSDDLQSKLAIGPVLVARKEAKVKRAVDRAWRTTTARGTRLVVFEGISLTSDAAELLGAEADIVVGFGYEVEVGAHKLILSTRSHTTYDCAALAKHFGGGGHTKAAGFSKLFEAMSLTYPIASNPYDEVLSHVERFERGWQ